MKFLESVSEFYSVSNAGKFRSKTSKHKKKQICGVKKFQIRKKDIKEKRNFVCE